MYVYKKLIRLFNIETAFKLLKVYTRVASKLPWGLSAFRYKPANRLNVNLFDLEFKNPIGSGLGLDRNGMMYNELTDLGFSFVEVGPIGAAQMKDFIRRVSANPCHGLLALCINRDHEKVFSMTYDFADMFDFQIPDDSIIDVLTHILDIRLTYDTCKPIMLRLTHELPSDVMADVLDFCRLNGVDAIVIGKTENVRMVSEYTNGRYPIIGYGELRSPKSIEEMLKAGASLVQITTGLVLDGPSLVKKSLKYLDNSKITKS